MTHVLIAEDDPGTARVLTETLGQVSGTTTEVIANGALVPGALSERRPDLLILDVALPGLSGMDVFDIVRNDEAHRGIPVLFLTARPEEARAAFAATGEHRVIAKPFDIDELLRAIAEMTRAPEAAEPAA